MCVERVRLRTHKNAYNLQGNIRCNYNAISALRLTVVRVRKSEG
jgi:hypothetical protein